MYVKRCMATFWQKLGENKSDALILLLFAYMSLTSFFFQSVYAKAAPYGTLISAAVLTLLMFIWKDRLYLRKFELTAAALANGAALLMLILIGSNKGAFLVIFDMSAILLLSGVVRLSDMTKRILCATGGVALLWWYSYVRWDYGFNMAGLIFLVLMIMGEIFLEYVKDDFEFEYLKYVQILLVIVTFLFEICYHARSAALCVLVFAFSFMLLPKLSKNRALYETWIALFTIGSIVFTVIYVLLAKYNLNAIILYKEILSGRQDIWLELWQQFLAHPLTGIGSSYQLKSFFIFEVHNGFFDILSVHGIVVFVLVLLLCHKRLIEIGHTHFEWYPDKRIAAAGIYTLFAASFFENCFIVPPYSVVFFVLMMIGME